jgi:hypothetical protein
MKKCRKCGKEIDGEVYKKNFCSKKCYIEYKEERGKFWMIIDLIGAFFQA